MIFDAIIMSLLPFEDYSGNQLLVLERTIVMWTEQWDPLTKRFYLKCYQLVWLERYDGVFLSHAHTFLLDNMVKSWSAHTEGSAERQQLAKVPELCPWRVSCPNPCQGIPDKLQLCARMTPIKMTLGTPCRWRWSLHKVWDTLWGAWERAFSHCRKLIMGHLRKERRQGRKLI